MNKQTLERFIELSNISKVVEKELKALKEELMTFYGNDSSYTKISHGYAVSLKITTAEVFNSDAFKKDFLDIYNQYKRPSERKSFSVSPIS